MRYGVVALLGRSNVGKSTFLNRALRQPLAIVANRPQTTRDALLGVVHLDGAQIAFVDTPGVHPARHELGRRMNAAAVDAARAADVVGLMLDVSPLARSSSPSLHPEDLPLFEVLDQLSPHKSILLVNKVDRLRDKSRLLPWLKEASERHAFDVSLPLSALAQGDVELALSEIATLLPEGPAAYGPDTLTDRTLGFFAREYVREQLLLQTAGEVAHGAAVAIDSIEESPTLLRVSATIFVEKPGQKAIVVGRSGGVLKRVGTAARARLQELVQKRVYLKLFVKVTPRWRNLPRHLHELGYDIPNGTGHR